MSKVIFIIFTFVFIFSSCKTMPKPEQENTVEQGPAEPDKKEKMPIVEEKMEESEEEYARSVLDVDISRAEFSADKKEILRIIEELSKIMEKHDYDEWLKYIDKASINYWSNPANLKLAAKRIPKKYKQLNNLRDYFENIFIPSRKDRTLEEIRYISKNSVKAVQIDEEQKKDIVFYNFVRSDGKWMVRIPPLPS